MNKKGFTLIELLIVVVIVGLLSTAAIMSFGSARIKARDAKRVGDIAALTKALTLYMSSKNIYPVTVPEICLDGTDLVNDALIDEGVVATPIRDPLYPDDVVKCYRYSSNAAGTQYTLKYFLDTTSDSGEAGDHSVYND
ncbi:MAG: putative General secretion pathway protein GspG [Parcubacteria group bacterium Gr01-1014_18]|nr:MAG: putative General secretion pathway protein GspG [Parcubacteria group bacterium Greene0416_36]TSC81377.1 MAG: putative General secretion pathway protein GspG [Parcubacteria group bacterium Gr01-1014_18]TSC99437.1 MAG: putative General secretion pathway protein GspG [Parcubacteria group bacterium Greene1014_20]TSD07644.1 MAG: putative General secretion pathway protein GspG [Parcubacteria group bacterium Greene0714_2]